MTLEEDVTDYANAVEAAAVNLKHRIARRHGVSPEKTETLQDTREPLKYNPEKIPWIRTEGPKGVYERYPAFQQKPSMSVDYTNLLEDLKSHNGKLQCTGLFYWLFDDSTIGRKPAKKR